MDEFILNGLAGQQAMQAQQSVSLAGLLGGSAGVLGGILQQQGLHPLSLSNTKANLWPEYKLNKAEIPVVPISFFDALRNEIDEWLKL